MIRAAIIMLALASEAHAQPVACAFTLVCAPEIECETHGGIPFEIDFRDDTYVIEVDGAEVTGSVVSPPPSLALNFAVGEDRMLFSFVDGEGVLTRHSVGPGGRLTAVSFLGVCMTP